jgi:hypothetical protein
MITKFLYATVLFGFGYIFFSTSQLPRLIYTNFIAAPAASQQLAPAGTNQQQQPLKKATTAPASPQKVNIVPPVSVSTLPTTQTPAQLGFLFVVGLLNLFVCYRLMRWLYRVFLKTPLNLLIAAARFLFVKPYRYLTTPQITAHYEFMRPVPSCTAERSVIVQ